MKVCVCLFCLFFGLSSYAESRKFRLVPDSVNGVALAWGVMGESTDFESIETQDEKAMFQFINEKASKFTNYLVDIQTNTILDNVCEDSGCAEFTVGSIGGYKLAGSFYSKLVKASAVDLPYDYSVVASVSGSRWFESIDSIYLIKREGGKASLVQKYKNAWEDLESQISARLTKEQMQEYQDKGANWFETKLVEDKERSSLMSFQFEKYVPRSSDRTTMMLEGTYELIYSKDKIALKLVELKVHSGVN